MFLLQPLTQCKPASHPKVWVRPPPALHTRGSSLLVPGTTTTTEDGQPVGLLTRDSLTPINVEKAIHLHV